MKRTTVATIALSLLIFSCRGTLDFGDNDFGVVEVDEDGKPVFPDNDPITDLDDPIDPVVGDNDPTLPNTLEIGTVGERCTNGQIVEYLVLSDAASSCELDAANVDRFNNGDQLVGAAVIALNGQTQIQQTVQYCDAAGACGSVALDINLVSNSWTGTVAGEARNVNFSRENCDYDAVAPPPVGDIPARGISITDAAVYQGVKVPIIQQGAPISMQRNSPVVANRQGVIRAFVQPQADWEPRDLVARLTIGDIVKEVPFTPNGTSSETDPTSTINFDLLPNELAPNVQYSLELLEAQSCSNAGGQVATARIPATGTVPLESEALTAPMKIVLVPLQYNGDGSGRLPATDAATIEKFKNEALTNFPVPDVEFTVREPVAYNNSIAPNGTGWGAMLNFCLSVRANDNPAPDTYYYCIAQPTQTAQQFCGGGCVAGLGPVPGAGDVQNRGSVGIGFNGSGEGTFIHEVGHSLGRPHSPCGGAGGPDPSYPHAQGRIGSWGYNILSGELINPDATDFMGYCNNTWVSDYTFGRVFTRLKSVIGTATSQTITAPKRWKTAILDIDGQMKWGQDINLKTLPTGLPASADLFDYQGGWVRSPEVYVTPVADLDILLLTVEDTGFSGGTIDVPGIGQITMQ